MVPILDYNSNKGYSYLKSIQNRSILSRKDAQSDVESIIADVKKRGDEAVFEYTQRFDGAELQNARVSAAEVAAAYAAVNPGVVAAIEKSVERVSAFHLKQLRNSWIDTSENGEILGTLTRAVESAGVYVPGGTAAYPSSVIMNAIPAVTAGVSRVIMCSPPDKNGKLNPAVLVAADKSGVTEIYKVGGAQAIAAMAFGTDTIPRVDKIVGPGNIYVALAKRAVFGFVGIDSEAGPSEILIIADDRASSKFVAADMLSQAEHDELASAILVTTSPIFAVAVKEEIIAQTAKLSRAGIIEKALANAGAIFLVNSIDEAVAVSNAVAPEHLEICVADPFSVLPLIKNAGAVFLGNYSPEPLGDYMAGPNHVLPTSGTARFFSPLGVDDFVKRTSVISFSKKAFAELAGSVIDFAEAEGLTAHANSIRVRL